MKGVCEVCGQSPTFKETGLCGPCESGDASTFGDGDTWPDKPKGKASKVQQKKEP